MKKARKKKDPDADNISRRQRAFKQLRGAEASAHGGLRTKSYHVLAWNFRHPLDEISLIARRGRLLIFVEVKFRADRDAGPYAVSPAQWRRSSAGASGFLARHPHYAGLVWRFDMFFVGGNGRFRHNKNFWCP